MEQAARGGQLEAMRWLRGAGCRWSPAACVAAAASGSTEALAWLHAQGCPWDPHACAAAAEGGHLDALDFLYQNNCPWDGDRGLVPSLTAPCIWKTILSVPLRGGRQSGQPGGPAVAAGPGVRLGRLDMLGGRQGGQPGGAGVGGPAGVPPGPQQGGAGGQVQRTHARPRVARPNRQPAANNIVAIKQM
eukprot:scaffold68832_cov45-Prasinocladus_malaysianus.AAC.2